MHTHTKASSDEPAYQRIRPSPFLSWCRGPWNQSRAAEPFWIWDNNTRRRRPSAQLLPESASWNPFLYICTSAGFKRLFVSLRDKCRIHREKPSLCYCISQKKPRMRLKLFIAVFCFLFWIGAIFFAEMTVSRIDFNRILCKHILSQHGKGQPNRIWQETNHV